MAEIYFKKISKIILLNLLMFIFIFIVAISVLSIPRDIDFYYSSGGFHSTESFETVIVNAKDNIKLIFSTNVFETFIKGSRLMVTIGDLLKTTLKKSTIIFMGSIILALLFGIIKGIFDSRRKKDSTLKLLVTLFPLSIPDIFSVVLIQSFGAFLYFKGIKFLGLGPIMYVGSDSWVQSIYPIIALSIVPAAYIARITASAIERVYDKDYILAARGKGCSELRIIMVHTMRNALAEILAAFPNIIAIMFSSLIVVEVVFSYKGLGYYIYTLNSHAGQEGRMGFIVLLLTLVAIYYGLMIITSILKDVILPDAS